MRLPKAWLRLFGGMGVALLLVLGAFAAGGSTDAAHPTLSAGQRPTISGLAQVGRQLTADPGQWDPRPTRFTFQWLRNGSPIRSARSRTFTPAQNVVGAAIAVQVTGFSSSGQTASRTSPNLRPLRPASAFTSSPRPRVAGTNAPGSTLVAITGAWGPGAVQFAYQWYVNSVARVGATGLTFAPKSADVGSPITVAVTGSEPGFTSVVRMSKIRPPRTPVSGVGETEGAPSVPLLDSVAGVGLGVQATWEPNPLAQVITSYQLVATPLPGASAVGCAHPAAHALNVSATDTSAIVPGLCAGVVYVVAISATNVNATSPVSGASSPVVPFAAQAPELPLIVSTTPRDDSLIVAWTPPAYSGGSPVTGYTVEATADGVSQTVLVPEDDRSATITGLTDGTAYQLALVASNAVGPSAAAASSGTPSLAYAPSAPQESTALPDGSGAVKLSWQPPLDDGGAAVSGYTITYQQAMQGSDGTWTPVNGAALHTVDSSSTDLALTVNDFETLDAFYQFSISAENSVGTGVANFVGTPVTPAVQATTGTVVLTAATVNALSAATDTDLTWKTPFPTQAAAFAVGDVIVASSGGLLPDGTLRRVTAVGSTATVLTVSTVAAQLTDAFSSGSVSATVNPASDVEPSTQPISTAAATFHPAVAGVRLLPADFGISKTFSKSLDFSFDFHGQSGSGCDSKLGSCRGYEVKGSLDVTPSVTLGLDVNQGFAGIPDGVTVTSSAVVDASADFNASVNGTQTWQIGEIDGAPIDVQIGPVPLVIVPKVPVFLTVTGSAAIDVSASITVGASVSWTSQNPNHLTTKNLTTPIKLSGGPIPGLTATGDLSASLQIQPQLDIYDIGGPNVEADVDLDAAINFNPAPGDSFLVITPSLVLKAGLDLDLFGEHASLDVTVGEIDGSPFKIGSVPELAYDITTISPSVSVGKPASFAAVRSDGATVPLTWGLLGGASGDKITAAGVFTPASPAGRTVTVTVTDSTGAEGSTTVAIGSAFDPPGSLMVSQDVAGSSAARISWTAPRASGGAKITQYRVTTAPSTGTHITTSTTIVLSALSSRSYAATVIAVNSQFIASPPATTTFAVANNGDLAEVGGVTGVANFPGAQPGQTALGLSYIACSGASLCAASNADGEGNPLLSVLKNEAWSSVAAPLPAGATTTAPTFLIPACDAFAHCFAVGRYLSSSLPQNAVIDTYNGASWSTANAPGTGSGNSSLDMISCAGNGYCLAAGGNLLETLSNGVWAASNLTTSLGFDSGSNTADLVALSCGAAGECGAVGEVDSTGGASHEIVATLHGGSWVTSTVPVPSDAQVNANVVLGGVSCTVTRFCAAVGEYTNKAGFGTQLTVTERDGAWKAQTAPSPTNASPHPGGGGNILYSVSCTSPTSCAAVGTYRDLSANTDGLNEVFDGTEWTAAEAPVVAGTAGPTVNDLWNVSCTPSGSCVAIGSYWPASGGEFVYAEIFANGSWSAVSPADLAAAGAGTSGAEATSIACPTTRSCIAVGAGNNNMAVVLAFTLPL